MFVKRAFLQICSKFTGEDPCRRVISIKLVCNFTKLTFLNGCFPVYMLHICRTHFWRTLMGDCSWICNVKKLVKMILKNSWYFANLNYPRLLNFSLKADLTTSYSCKRYQNVGNEFQFTVLETKMIWKLNNKVIWKLFWRRK